MAFKRGTCSLTGIALAVLMGGFHSASVRGMNDGTPYQIPIARYEVVNRFPHDSAAFTQGLAYDRGFLYESTGLNGQSSLRKVKLRNGRVLSIVTVPEQHFAEGLAILGKRVYQLTWLSKVCFVYNLKTFQLIGTLTYDWEGWGLAHDGTHLIMSDGTNTLRFIDPTTFRVERSIDISLEGQPLMNLNELEYVEGEIYANIWHSNSIARIDPSSGRVHGMIDLSGLDSGMSLGSEDVLNGIAYDSASKRLFVTGKRWPYIFEIRLV